MTERFSKLPLESDDKCDLTERLSNYRSRVVREGRKVAVEKRSCDRGSTSSQAMKQRFSRLISTAGHELPSLVADAAAHPLSQAGVVAFCLVWWASGLPTDILTATLSIAAITLTQMVLNSQRLREEDDRRRDIAMHAKLDELLRAEQFARKELAGIENLEAEEIDALKLRVARSRSVEHAAG